MIKGLLRVEGSISIQNFWPPGKSDADTAKVVVDVGPKAFQFCPPNKTFGPTKVFYTARVRGKAGTKPCISKEKLTVRLQGIDAPELHYRAQSLKRQAQLTPQQRDDFKKLNKEFRQHQGETATLGLVNKLKEATADPSRPIQCRVETRVDKPDDVFDTYGRFVGDISIRIRGKWLNLNTWLVENGWALPSFYVSMDDFEIEPLIQATRRARRRGICKFFEKKLLAFDSNLVYRNKAVPQKETGRFIFPKLYRRQVNWEINHQAGIYPGQFSDFLKDKKDACYLTADFLSQGSTASQPRELEEFLDQNGSLKRRPEELIFQEAKSELIDSKGKPVTRWQ